MREVPGVWKLFNQESYRKKKKNEVTGEIMYTGRKKKANENVKNGRIVFFSCTNVTLINRSD